ncbi:hypothetical protein BCR42DRAFT_208964 [Absidia repens]|uniref:PB1 domain-containing protein n=1 Tax=Absidia repens TaxID=90262 RepID=A0A1X2IQG7_9FUNG|nr:hypothetical protein BCR42DRAFT_208964 [Absidia repens]
MADTESILSITSMTSCPTHSSCKDSNSNSNSHSSPSVSCSTTTATTIATTALQQQQQNEPCDFFTFKFKHGNKTYRLRTYQDQFDILYKMIEAKLGMGFGNDARATCSTDDDDDDAIDCAKQQSTGFNIFYLDEDNDMVVMTENADVMDAVQMARYMGQERVFLYVIFDDAGGLDHNTDVSSKNGKAAVDPMEQRNQSTCGGNGKTEMNTLLSNNNNNNNNCLNDKNSKNERSNVSQGSILIPTAITIFGVLLLGVLSRTKPSCRL